jgi:hypothetical protein
MNLALFGGATIFTAVFFFKDSSYKATWILAERRAHDCRSLLNSRFPGGGPETWPARPNSVARYLIQWFYIKNLTPDNNIPTTENAQNDLGVP